MDQRQQLSIGQVLAVRGATAPPGPVAADATRERLAHRRQQVCPSLRVNPGILRSASLTKYAVAFLESHPPS